MKKLNYTLLAAALAASTLLVSNQTQAQGILKITEVQSSEAAETTFTNSQDWFELSNVGNAAVNVTGYTMDDNSDLFSKSVVLMGITSIAAGESVVFFETTGTSPTLTAADFQAWWGSSLSPALQIGTYSGSGVGLSSSSDQVNIFTSTGTPVDGVLFNTATTGYSFVFDTGAAGRLPTGLSQLGVNGAFASVNGDVGSPGVIAAVPEPSTLALAGISLAALAGLRRSQNRKA
ncbi:MAG TPA: lamin tail domain-containing protein [Verrucomicrobiae bacterium]|jgi:hypothetical protein